MVSVYLYKNLLFLRKRNGWTQAEMQDRCGISGATWSNYENGKTDPDIQTIIKISRTFKVNIDDLLTVNLENVHLIENNPAEKRKENVHLNVHPSVHLNQSNSSQNSLVEDIKNAVTDELKLANWGLLNQLRIIDQKLDQLRSEGQK